MNYSPNTMSPDPNYVAKHTTSGAASGSAGTPSNSGHAAVMTGMHPGGAGFMDGNMATVMSQFSALGVNGPGMGSGRLPMGYPVGHYVMGNDGMLYPGGFPASQVTGQAPINPEQPYFMPGSSIAYPGWQIPPAAQYGELIHYNAARVPETIARHEPEKLAMPQHEVPGLENRRSSYSTNESTPATPFFGSTASRDPAVRVAVFERSNFTTPSPQQITSNGIAQQPKGFAVIPIDRDLEALLAREPAIPDAVPAVFTPSENMKSLEQSLSNPIPGNRNVYIRGLHPTTDDELLYKYAERFGRVETSKAIIDTTTGACKGFGFAKFFSVRDSEACIRGFHKLGYEVGFARVVNPPINPPPPGCRPASPVASAIDSKSEMSSPTVIGSKEPFAHMSCGCKCEIHTDLYTNFDAWDQESFNSRLKAEGDDQSTNLYISNLPKSVTENELAAIFLGYSIMSSKILRDGLGNSRGVGFARFESREICNQIIKEYQGQPLGEEGLAMSIRYADTPSQKELKRVTAERRQFRTNEYNVGAYGTPLVGMSPTIYSQSGGWKRSSNGSTTFARGPSFSQQLKENKVAQGKLGPSSVGSAKGPSSEDGSGDEGITIHVDSPLVANGSTRSSPVKQVKQEKD